MRSYQTDDRPRSTQVPEPSDLVRHCQRHLSAAAAGELDAHMRWIDRRPNDPLPYYHLAEMYRWYGHIDLWREAVDTAFDLVHHTPEQIVERAHAKLLLGDWSGWRDRELRFFIPSAQSAFPHRLRSIRERWDGSENISDKSLLVVSDGGFGDCIQMLRYVPWIASVADRVALAVQPELDALVHYNFPNAQTSLITESYDRYASIISLPAMAGTLPPFIPLCAPAPYRNTDERLRVGICWAGSPLTHMELRQPLALDAFTPLLARAEIRWFSLQIGPRARELAEYPSVALPPVPLATFAETANLIAGLDAVVTVDTSVAHLAGSLGVPTYLLLHVVADPRWGLGDTTAWYPTMRLIRQRTPGDWHSVIDQLGRQLYDFATAERPARRAQ